MYLSIKLSFLLLPLVTIMNLDDLTRTLTTRLAERKFTEVTARFDETMVHALPPAALAQTWEQVLGQAGAFKSIAAIRHAEAPGHKVLLADCSFERAALTLKFVYDHKDRIAGFFIVPTEAPKASWQKPDYADPTRFVEREVEFGDPSWTLPGTLTLPLGKGPFAAAILVHGSGPNDRDEAIGGTRVFKDLAWGLASRGVAVLRYDKRTHVYPKQFVGAYTSRDEVIEPAVAALSWLARQPEIAARKIFVVGHSQGGYLAPRIAAEARAAGLVVMAGSVRPVEDLVIEQLTYLKASPATLEAARATARQIKDPALTARDTVDLLGSKLPGSYFLDVRDYNPAAVAASARRPILILQGERDYQVTKTDYDLWRKELDGKPFAKLHWIAGLNHLFVRGQGASLPSEYLKEGHVDAEVIKEIGQFVAKH